MEDDHVEQKLEMEVAPAQIAVHPNHKFVSISVGFVIRVFNLSNGSGVNLVDYNGGHKDSVRAIGYSKSGGHFVSAGDDKLVKIWDTDSWRSVYSIVSEKRVTSLAISPDERFVCFADKFGVVHLIDVRDYKNVESSPVIKKAVPILSHYCSIITRLEFSPDGRCIISADRDFKIRATVFPKEPLNGVHEIQSFCLGHTEFVSALAFVGDQHNSQAFLVSGSGDSTVRLWEYTSGSLLDTFVVGDKIEGQVRSAEQQEEIQAVITDLCATSNGSMVAVAIQSFSGVMLLRHDHTSKTLFLTKVISVKEEVFIPMSIAAATSTLFIWMVMGASSLETSDSGLVRLKVISVCSSSGNCEPETVILDDDQIPGGDKLLNSLQGQVLIGETAFSAAAEAVKRSVRNLLIKKQSSSERRELRKRGRNDKKLQQT